MKNIYDKSVEEKVEQLSHDVEFLHEVPVSLPAERIEEIRNAFKTHTLALIDAEIERVEGMEQEADECDADDTDCRTEFHRVKGYNQAIQDQLTYLKEQREIISNS